MIRSERLTADLQGPFAVFLIGMRINKLWKVHQWLPVARAMPRMLKELAQRPQEGMLGAEMWFGRTTIMLQYWRSVEQLLTYATNRDAVHLPAWRAFNQAVGVSGDVGIWHEMYSGVPGTYENVYVNMPPFGLGKVGNVRTASGELRSALERIRASGSVRGAASPQKGRLHA
jgi:hypothetical protein